MNSARKLPKRVEDAFPRLGELPNRIDRVEYLARMLPIILHRAHWEGERRGG